MPPTTPKAKAKKIKHKKIQCINELYNLALTSDFHKRWLIMASNNLGGAKQDVEGAKRWLEINAMETDEEGVVEEINFVLDIVPED